MRKGLREWGLPDVPAWFWRRRRKSGVDQRMIRSGASLTAAILIATEPSNRASTLS